MRGSSRRPRALRPKPTLTAQPREGDFGRGQWKGLCAATDAGREQREAALTAQPKEGECVRGQLEVVRAEAESLREQRAAPSTAQLEEAALTAQALAHEARLRAASDAEAALAAGARGRWRPPDFARGGGGSDAHPGPD